MSSSKLLKLWGKTNSSDYHPAIFHMIDAGMTAQSILTSSASQRFIRFFHTNLVDTEINIIGVISYLVALHDIGKISAFFQTQVPEQKSRLESEGFQFFKRPPLDKLHHTLIGKIFIENSFSIPAKHVVSEAISGHHGYYSITSREFTRGKKILQAYECSCWQTYRETIAEYLKTLWCSGQDVERLQFKNDSVGTLFLTGLTIFCDWIASNTEYFPIVSNISLENYIELSQKRAKNAISELGFNCSTASSVPANFQQLFSQIKQPRPLQQAVDDIPAELYAEPSLTIIEAPTGEGKTETMLAVVHKIAQKSGTDEFYCGMPTAATSNQMLTRIESHLHDNLKLNHGAKLIHGMSFIYENDLRAADSDAIEISKWFNSSRRALLYPFGVGTVDQAELGVLNAKFFPLRICGLVGKTLIIDEIHAYDTYMTTVLERLLEWCSMLGISVVLVSATLQNQKRTKLMQAYGCEVEKADFGYPALWVGNRKTSYLVNPPSVNPDKTTSLHILQFPHTDYEGKAQWIWGQIKDGGNLCWVCNIVRRSQQLYEALCRVVPADVEIILFNSQMPLFQRKEIENRLVSLYGKGGSRPTRSIVIATQVIEQSLDVNFDVMVSDLAPIDLLLQRDGRNHRHDVERPAAHREHRLYINIPMNDDGNYPNLKGDSNIYDPYTLLKTWQLLTEQNEFHSPADYRKFIEFVYGADTGKTDKRFIEACEQLNRQYIQLRDEANLRTIPSPHDTELFSVQLAERQLQFEENENSNGWFIAKTRLGRESINIIPLECSDNENEGINYADNQPVNLSIPADFAVAKSLLMASIRVSNNQLIKAIRNQHPTPTLFSKSQFLGDFYPLLLKDRRAAFIVDGAIVRVELNEKIGLIIDTEVID